MRLSSTLSLTLALTFGGIAAFLAYGLSAPRAASPRPETLTQTVVVAAQPVAFGLQLTPENLREVAMPIGAVPDGAFTSVSALVKDGRRLSLTALQRHEPILAGKVTGPNQRATLSTQIDPGMRAVSIRVDEVRGVSGFVLPGDRVDVVLTRGDSAAQDNAYADVLLQYAKVLAVDQVANERQDKPAVARAVTLEVDVLQAQKLILAQGVGRLSLLLRQPDGAPETQVQRVTAGDLGGVPSPAAVDRVALLEKQISDLNAAAELSAAREKEGAGQRVADLEARVREDLARSGAPRVSADPPNLRSPDQVINVIRNGSKREQYTVAPERR